MSVHHQNFCEGCMQDVIRGYQRTLGATAQQPCFAMTIKKFAQAANQAGSSTETLITILKAGVPISEILDVIQSRLESQDGTPRSNKHRASRVPEHPPWIDG